MMKERVKELTRNLKRKDRYEKTRKKRGNIKNEVYVDNEKQW